MKNAFIITILLIYEVWSIKTTIYIKNYDNSNDAAQKTKQAHRLYFNAEFHY